MTHRTDWTFESSEFGLFVHFWQHFSEKTKSNQASSAREGRACSALATAWSTVATSFNTSSTWQTGKLWETPSLLGKCCRPWCQAELANWHEPDPCHDRLPKGNRDKRKHRHRWSHWCTFHSVPCRALVVGPSDAYQKWHLIFKSLKTTLRSPHLQHSNTFATFTGLPVSSQLLLGTQFCFEPREPEMQRIGVRWHANRDMPCVLHVKCILYIRTNTPLKRNWTESTQLTSSLPPIRPWPMTKALKPFRQG